MPHTGHPAGESSPLLVASASPPGKLLRFWSDAGPSLQAPLTTTTFCFLGDVCLTFVSPISNPPPPPVTFLFWSLVQSFPWGSRERHSGRMPVCLCAAWLWDSRLKLFLEI